MTCHLWVGVGSWSFSTITHLPGIPRKGDYVAASGDGRVYTVESVTLTPTLVYVRCYERFKSEKEAENAAREWEKAEEA